VRLVSEADLPALLEVFGSEEVTEFLAFAAWKSMPDAEAWLKRMSSHQDSGSAWQFVIVAKQTGKAIGTCSLFQFEEENTHAKMGYALGRDYWRSGYMQEALAAVIDCAFGEMSLRRLQAEVEAKNTASGRLLQRLGFTREGILRERWLTKSGSMNAEIYGLLRHEWATAKAPA
jgi:RimJ/RimL family protein N-acetyltransferase